MLLYYLYCNVYNVISLRNYLGLPHPVEYATLGLQSTPFFFKPCPVHLCHAILSIETELREEEILKPFEC